LRILLVARQDLTASGTAQTNRLLRALLLAGGDTECRLARGELTDLNPAQPRPPPPPCKHEHEPRRSARGLGLGSEALGTFAKRRRSSCWMARSRGGARGKVSRVEAGQLIHLPADREHAYRVVSDRAHYYLLIMPAGFETFFQEAGTVLDQQFEGELPIPGPVSPEKVSELVAVLTPLGASITGPPPFGPEA
jgi:hypothetical protein